jgi:hypothetical protein
MSEKLESKLFSVLHANRMTLLLVLFWFGFVVPSRSQERNLSKRLSLAFEVGNWQPHSLNDEPRFDTFGAAGATPFYGLAFSVPLGGGLGLRMSVGYWSLRDLEKIETVHSLTLHPISVDMKYWFVPDYKLSAYIMYGGGVYWGVENETSPFGTKFRKARAGWGASLGAGFDFLILEGIGLGIAFQYHYVRFKKPLGGVADFSGPKIAVQFFFFL